MKMTRFIILLLFVVTGCKGDNLMWQEKGTIFQNIVPGVDGDMLVDQNESIYIFDPVAPANIQFKPDDGPADEYKPEFTEEWMNNVREWSNRETVRLFRTSVDSDPSLLFSKYGQKSYWWTSKDINTIYILVEWADATKKTPEPAHLTFWKSTNKGVDFKKIDWNNHLLGRGSSIGMYFDKEGVNGYIFVDKNTLWQTSDKGETWRKVYIPHTDAKRLPYMEEAIDTATVDEQGNLLFALFKEGKTLIYQIPATNKEVDLSQIDPKYQIPSKRLLSMNSVTDSKGGLYLFYINCEDEQCTWYTDVEEKYKGKKNQPLRFTYFERGKYTNDQSLGFFLPVKKVYSDEYGKIAVTLEQPNKPYYALLLSSNYGKTWVAEELTNTNVVSDYVDLDNEQYWQNRMFNKVYMAKDIFK